MLLQTLAKEAACAENGRSCRIRTCDPLVPNQVRYQTAPNSDTEYVGVIQFSWWQSKQKTDKKTLNLFPTR